MPILTPLKPLTAVVMGAGWAGQGHVKALQYCGVDVLALCARTPVHLESVARKFNIPIASTDWHQTLIQLKPDIVTIATPANLRLEVVEVATQLGCHIVAEKPLAATAVAALKIYALVKKAGVKHAYGATHRYDPGVIYLSKQLENKIGKLRHIDSVFCGPFDHPLTPWDVNETLAYGGGILNLGFTHFLSMIEWLSQGTVTAATGEAYTYRTRAPVIDEYQHDSRERRSRQLTTEEAHCLEWRSRDGDDAFTVLMKVASPFAENDLPVTVFAQCNVFAPIPSFHNGWRFLGSEGTIHGDGVFTLSLSQQRESDKEVIPIPEEIGDALPDIGDETENRWAALFRDFVADIRGEQHDPYLTFADGWRYQEIIDAIRYHKGWFQVPISI